MPTGTPRGVMLGMVNAIGSALFLALLGFMIESVARGGTGMVVAGVGVLGFGLTQIPGVVVLVLKYCEDKSLVQGLLVTSGILFLLNAGCWGLVMGSFRR